MDRLQIRQNSGYYRLTERSSFERLKADISWTLGVIMIRPTRILSAKGAKYVTGRRDTGAEQLVKIVAFRIYVLIHRLW